MKKFSSLALTLTIAACGGGDGAQTTTAAPADSTPAAQGSGKFSHPVKAAPMVDTGVVASPQSLVRESYAYSFRTGSRDPFRQLNTITVEGPELPDLRLVSLIFNRNDPRQSLATFRDIQNNKRYNVRPGDRIGRLLLVSVDSAGGAILRVNDFGTVREQPYTLRKEDGN